MLSGATPRYVTLHAPDWSIDEAELRAAFSDRTRAIIVNTPHNPTGKVFSREELDLVAELCQTHDVLCLTDEIYEHIVYDAVHVPPATVPGLEDRTVTINALSKTYAVTGWRVGWTIAPPAITSSIRKVHDFLTVGAAAPLQAGRRRGDGAAGVVLRRDGGGLPRAARRPVRRPRARRASGSRCPRAPTTCCARPATSTRRRTRSAFARRLVVDPGVAVVPGTSFFADPADGAHLVRFAFPKRLETLHAAAERLARL